GRRWWSLHLGQDRQEAWAHRPWSARHDECGLWRRRLEDALLHHPEHALLGQREDRGRPRPGEEENRITDETQRSQRRHQAHKVPLWPSCLLGALCVSLF